MPLLSSLMMGRGEGGDSPGISSLGVLCYKLLLYILYSISPSGIDFEVSKKNQIVLQARSLFLRVADYEDS